MEEKDYKKLYEEQLAHNKILEAKNRRLTSLVTAYRTHLLVIDREISYMKSNAQTMYSAQKDDKLNAYTPKAFIALGTSRIRNNPDGNYVLVMFDIDDFKGINDTYGHYAGDVALKKFVEIVNSLVREEIDLLGRFGGDEFVLLLENITLENAEKKINDLLCRIVDTPIDVTIDGNDVTFSVHASAGIAEFNKTIDYSDIELVDTDGLNETEIIERKIYRANFIKADTALYEAKTAGKNRASIADDSEIVKRGRII